MAVFSATINASMFLCVFFFYWIGYPYPSYSAVVFHFRVESGRLSIGAHIRNSFTATREIFEFPDKCHRREAVVFKIGLAAFW